MEDVTGEATYTATFNPTLRTYTITFINGDEVLQSDVLEYGQLPEYTGETPAKDADTQYTYEFAGWDKEIVAVDGDATYTATFREKLNTYTITWLNWDNSPIDETTVAYGELPAHEDPVRENSDEFTYTFTGWSPTLEEVSGDATYIATFRETKNTYTITWLNEDNSPIDETTVAYGEFPIHEDPVKEADAQYTYTFAGWSPDIESVTGDATYTATFEQTLNTYTITWLNEDGSLMDQMNLNYGDIPEYIGETPAKPADAQYTYTFAGWTPTIEAVTEDRVYTATYSSTLNTYTVIFNDEDGTELQRSTLEYGQLPEYTGETPAKPADAQYTYTFAGWTPTLEAVTEDRVYTALYSSTVNTYTITWLNWDNTPIDQTTVPYGELPTHADPVRENTDELTYTFTGWSPALEPVTGDATYTATFSEAKTTYTITWLNWDGSLIYLIKMSYGEMPEYLGTNPTKPADAQYTYTFAGWTPTLEAVTEDRAYTAIYSSTVNSYTITWLNWDNSPIDETTVAYGELPTHEDPAKEADAQYTYTFAGWDPELVAVTGDATYTATFSSTVNQYTVTFYDEDGTTVLDRRKWDYGAMPTCDDPTKPAEGSIYYYFTGWKPEITAVTGKTSYTATFAADETDFGPNIIPEDSQGDPVQWPVAHGTTIYLHVLLEDCQTFHWSDILDSSSIHYKENPRPYAYEGVQPEFAPVMETIVYHISANADEEAHGKAILILPESKTLGSELNVACGEWVELQAVAAEDWHFDHWNDGDTSLVRQVEVTADAQYIAYFASNCGDYPSLPVVSLYDWLLMLDVRAIHEKGYTFGEEDVTWYRVKGEPDKEEDGPRADDERVGTGYSFSINESLVNSGDYYATVDVSNSPAGVLCTEMMRSQIVHYAASVTRADAPPMLTPTLVHPNEPQHILHLNLDASTTVMIYDISGHLLRTLSEDRVDQINLSAESVAGCYQVLVQNGDQRTVLRYIVVK